MVQPEKLDIDIGGHMAPNARIRWKNKALHYHHEDGPFFEDKIIKPSEEEWETFLEALEQLRVWDWKESYHADILDGIQWSIEIAFQDQEVMSQGSNCYPAYHENEKLGSQEGKRTELFNNFLGAVSELIGGKFYR